MKFRADADPLCRALALPLLACQTKAPSVRPANPDATRASAFLYLALAVAADQGGAETPAIVERVAGHVRSIATGGNEPSFNAGPFWGYALTSAALAVVRRTPALWNALDGDTRQRVDLLVTAFAVLASLVTDDDNDYRTGPLLNGNFHKDWNPNHRMAMVFPIVFAAIYDGSPDRTNARLRAFDFDAFAERLQAFGFTNALACFTFDPGNRALFQDGGTAFFRRDVPTTGEKANTSAGAGRGVRHDYHYHGHGLDDLPAIVADLYTFNYGGGPVFGDSSAMANGVYTAAELAAIHYDPALAGTPKAYIADRTRSPCDGLPGMMREFNSFDMRGIRSSAVYSQIDFILVVGTLFALETLGEFRLDADPALQALVRVGNEDCLYKTAHGYCSFSCGESHGVAYAAVGDGLALWQSAWERGINTPNP